MDQITSRRRFLSLSASLCGAAALGAIPPMALAQAPASNLDVKDPTAQALAYVENVATIKAGQESALKPGSNCANCQLYVKAQEKGGRAPCNIFGGKLVTKTGWCRAYAA